jgi:hypothetical protein
LVKGEKRNSKVGRMIENIDARQHGNVTAVLDNGDIRKDRFAFRHLILDSHRTKDGSPNRIPV